MGKRSFLLYFSSYFQPYEGCVNRHWNVTLKLMSPQNWCRGSMIIQAWNSIILNSLASVFILYSLKREERGKQDRVRCFFNRCLRASTKPACRKEELGKHACSKILQLFLKPIQLQRACCWGCCTVLYCTVLYCIALHCIALYCMAWHGMTWYSILWYDRAWQVRYGTVRYGMV